MRKEMGTKRDPKTHAEWQQAVDLAHVCPLITSARAYGLIVGGPQVDEGRCEVILQQGASPGITPGKDAVQRMLPAFLERS